MRLLAWPAGASQAPAGAPHVRGRLTGGSRRQQLLAVVLLCALCCTTVYIRTVLSRVDDTACLSEEGGSGSCELRETLAVRAARLLAVLGTGGSGSGGYNASLVRPLCSAAAALEAKEWPLLLTDAAQRACATLRRAQDKVRF